MKQNRFQTKFAKKQRKTSMFFTLWAAFALIAFLLLIVFSVTQSVVLKTTYENEAIRALDEKGARISRELRQTPPSVFGENYDGFVRFLSTREGIPVYILDGDGNVLMPLEENMDPSAEGWLENFDFSERIERHKTALAGVGATHQNAKSVVYESNHGLVYGAVLPPHEGNCDTYLYAYQSMELIEAVGRSMNIRMIWIAFFVFILTFAASSAISGVLIRPLDEVAAKAKRLAKGDFNVDFQGEDYLEEMQALSDSLNFAKDELSKADRMQKELLANVSHDFKTPLTMIKAYAEMIVEFAGENKEKRDKSARIIIEEADRLTSLVSDMLDLSKIRSGIQGLQLELFDISAYLKEILTRFDYLSETQGYSFRLDIDKGLYTEADKLKVGQVLYNLIGNAVNYTGEDKVVRIRLKKESDAIRFEVSDSGKGIQEEELGDIWDRYYRSSDAHKRPVKGTGLGLSIVKTILEKHAFRFGVHSVVGVGSSFYVFFPLRGEELDEESEEEA
jgi:signal transduction histidine kinase